jgi:hypothetical protein
VVDRAASASHDGVFDALRRRARGEGGMRTQVVIFPEGVWLWALARSNIARDLALGLLATRGSSAHVHRTLVQT